jgi:hypothetical protein
VRPEKLAASAARAVTTFGMYVFILFSLDFQRQRRLSAMAAGLELLPMPAVFAVVSSLTGQLATRVLKVRTPGRCQAVAQCRPVSLVPHRSSAA